MNNEINIENIMEKTAASFKKILTNRFLLYKSLALLAAVMAVASTGFLARNYFY